MAKFFNWILGALELPLPGVDDWFKLLAKWLDELFTDGDAGLVAESDDDDDDAVVVVYILKAFSILTLIFGHLFKTNLNSCLWLVPKFNNFFKTKSFNSQAYFMFGLIESLSLK